MRVQIYRKTEMYGTSKFFPAAKLKLFKCAFEAEREILVKKTQTKHQGIQKMIHRSILRDRILQNWTPHRKEYCKAEKLDKKP